MGKGYAEGSALEERLADLERSRQEPDAESEPLRPAVYGSTPDNPERHFIGWLGDVDPDRLFDSGAAWGLSVVRCAAPVR
jgi:hypothetical protein